MEHALPSLLDCPAATALQAKLLLADAQSCIILDASELDHVGVPGIQVMMAAARHFAGLRISNLQPDLHPLFAACGVAFAPACEPPVAAA
jgi:anti-anti-sigma regulatory factor